MIDVAFDSGVVASDAKRPHQQRVIQRLGEADEQAVAAASGRRLDAPRRGVQRLVFRRPDAQHAPEVLLERPPVLIAPLVTDDERHRAAGTQRATHLLIREECRP